VFLSAHTTTLGMYATNVPPKVRNCAMQPDNLRSAVSFLRAYKIPKHWKNTKTSRSCL